MKKFGLFLMLALWLPWCPGAAGGQDTAALEMVADHLVTNQIDSGTLAGAWPDEASYTGSIVAGLVRAYQITGKSAYQTAALSGGDYILATAGGRFYGDEAYALSRLSELAADPDSNPWRSALSEFYEAARNSSKGTTGVINSFDQGDLSESVFYLAHYLVAAYYVDAVDKAIWRNGLMVFLAGVEDASATYPVGALGIAAWALAQTGPLDDTLVSPSAASSSYWFQVTLQDLPGLLLGHQIPPGGNYPGSFYWRFDHTDGDAFKNNPVGGYTEDCIFGTLGLLAADQASASLDFSAAIATARESLLLGIEPDGSVLVHLWNGGTGYYVYGGEMLLALPPDASDPISYSLQVTVEGQGTVHLNPAGGSYEAGTTVQLTADPAGGYKLQGWYDETDTLLSSQTTLDMLVNNNRMIRVVFVPDTPPITYYSLQVTVEGQGTAQLNPTGGSYEAGTTVQLTAAPANGYQLQGWYDETDTLLSSQITLDVLVNSNRTIRAVFVPDTPPITYYSLQVTVEGQGTVQMNPTGGSYEAGTTVQLTAAPANGYQLQGWYDETDTLLSSQTALDVLVNNNRTIRAVFVPDTPPITYYSLQVTVQGQGTVQMNPTGGSYPAGTTVQLTAVPAGGYQLQGWYDETDTLLSGQTTLDVLVNSNRTIRAVFVPDTPPITYYSLQVAVEGQGTAHLNPAGGSYEAGTTVQLTAVPADGYQLQGWYDETDTLLSSQTTLVVLVDQDQVIQAVFDRICSHLTIQKMTIKADKSRGDNIRDSVKIVGQVDPNDLSRIRSQENDLTDLFVSISTSDPNSPYGYSEILAAENITLDAKGRFLVYKAKLTKGQGGRVTKFQLDLNKGTLTLIAQNIDLSGLACPLRVQVQIGHYLGLGVAAENTTDYLTMGIEGEEAHDVINGKSPMPMILLLSKADSLRVDKFVYKPGSKPDSDSLKVQGALSVQEPSVNIAQQEVTVHWGSYSMAFPAEDLYQVGTKKVYKYKKPKGTASPVAAAVFDLEKCTFQILIQKDTIGLQNSPVAFGIDFGSFSQSVFLVP